MIRNRLWALALTFGLVLLAVSAQVSPAGAQEVTEDPDGVTDQAFDTTETERYGVQASEMLNRYDELERLIERKEDAGEIDAQRDRYRDEQQRIDDTYESVVANFANARLRAIRDHGDAEQLLPEWEKETAALRSLEGYAQGELGYASDYDGTTEAIADEREAHEAQVSELRAAQDAPEGATPAAQTDTTGGPLQAIGNAVVGFVSFVFAMVLLTPLVLGGMFAVAWRREGSAGAAWRSTLRPGRLALAAGIAFVLWWLGGLAVLLVLVLAVAWFLLRRRAGGPGGAMGRVRSWFPPGPRGSGGPEEWDEERQGRNVAGAKGEAKVNQILASLTKDHHCYVFSNLSERGVGNIDHVLISPAGATIVETKANSGEAVLDERGNLTAGGRPFSRDPFEQAARQLEALSRRIGLASGEGDFRVCLASASSVQVSPRAPNADRLLTLADLAGVLSGLPARLSGREVDALAERIMGVYGAAPIASPSPSAGPPEPHGKDSTRRATEEMIRETARSFGKRHGVDVTYTDEAVDALLSLYESERRAGHPSLQRVVDSRVGRKLSELLSAGKVGAGGAVELAVRNGQVAFRRVAEKVRPGGDADPGEPPAGGPEDGGRSCPECGSEVGLNARFCGNCGRKLEDGG